ncbi:MAG: isocitrate lyase/phosphoenolpyruvate mutase family protein [Erythrobacter sp.]|nr:isocitrate lyase/phosphoenolpyruvate mutase family protein [Erythrobacter sp.]
MAADQFAALHTANNPLILFNIWDAGSARAAAGAGARAIATGSAALAGAAGFEDGEAIPFADFLTIARWIARATDLPLTVDFEAGFAQDISSLEGNAAQLAGTGAVGCNFEDRLIAREGLRPITEQASRIAAVARHIPFVNARTDLFLERLMAREDANRSELIPEALERAEAYAEAGARCFFVPGLSDPSLIAQLCERAPLPVNVMRLPGMIDNSELAGLGVARISYGPAPWRDAMERVEEAARAAFGGDPATD